MAQYKAHGVNYTVGLAFNATSKSSVGNLIGGVKKVTTGFKSMKEQAAQGTSKIKILNDVLKSITAGVVNLALNIGTKLIGAVKSAITSFKNLVKEGMELSKVQYEVEAKVKTVFGTEGLDALKKEASRIQGLGVIGDEKILQAAESMGAAGLTTEQTSALLEGVADIAAARIGLDATESDLQSIGDAVAKAVVNGQTKTLLQYLPTLDKAAFSNADAQTRIEMLTQAMEEANILGTNAALAQTDMGKVQQVQNEIGDVKEEIGKWGWKIAALFYDTIRPYLPQLQKIAEWVLSIATEALSKVADWLNQNKARLMYVIASIFDKVRTFVDGMDIGKIVDTITAVADRVLNIASNVASILKYMPWILAAIGIARVTSGIANAAQRGLTLGGGVVAGEVIGGATGAAMTAKNASRAYTSINPITRHFYNVSAQSADNFIKIGLFDNLIDGIKFVGRALLNFAKAWVAPVAIAVAIAVALGKFLEWLEKATGAITRFSNAFKNFFWGENKDYGDFSSENKYSQGGMGGKALGTPYAMPNTVTTINERGGEIMRLPGGTTIIPADKSAALLGSKGNVTVNVNVQGNVIGNRQFLDQIGSTVVSRLKTAMVTT